MSMRSELRSAVSTEFVALVDDLGQLTAAQWETPSLCAKWTVHDLVAHLCSIASLHAPALLLGLARARFHFDVFANSHMQRHRGSNPAATLTEFRQSRNRTRRPWLGEIVVHGADIRRPLGIPHYYAPGALRTVADFYKDTNMLIGAKSRIAGLALRATDEDWSHGTGQPVEGPLLSLLLVMTGRPAGCNDLNGPGTETLRSRCRQT